LLPECTDRELIEQSGKLCVALALIKFCAEKKEKVCPSFALLSPLSCALQVLLFTQSLGALDMVEKALNTEVEGLWPHKWKRGRDYLRLEGKDSARDRKDMVDAFNQTSSRPWLFIMSVKVRC
jgi:SNF2 family DNA or RNA helicase